MRSTSRRPWRSNRHSSTFSACAENSAKLVPRPSQVAPSGCGNPLDSRTLPVRNEVNCSQGRNNKIDLGNHTLVQRPYRTAVPDIAAAVGCRIGIENLAPRAGERHLDAIVAINFGREIDDDQATVMRVPSLAQPGEHAALVIVHHQPLEAGTVTVKLVQR